MFSGSDALLEWAKRKANPYDNVTVNDFSESWRDGLAFAAIVHSFFPEDLDFSSLTPTEPAKNLHIAFEAAEKRGVPKLVEPDDMLDLPKPDRFVVMTYVSQLYQVFVEKHPVGTPKRGRQQMSRDNPFCTSCSAQIGGEGINWEGNNYHGDCFKCGDCGKRLDGHARCLNISNTPYCEGCGKEAFVKHGGRTSTIRHGRPLNERSVNELNKNLDELNESKKKGEITAEVFATKEKEFLDALVVVKKREEREQVEKEKRDAEMKKKR
eukprot:TRINITY_DN1795_c0_g2_i2.p1 TRINITY_DN1795_c0_g2~~TRINITY_DN1795_c0_g2_i2.p1  ORF type:complete len:267 (-),score=65.02 TRINITY_DN1795_c0_g2_i2:5-805(-)